METRTRNGLSTLFSRLSYLFVNLNMAGRRCSKRQSRITITQIRSLIKSKIVSLQTKICLRKLKTPGSVVC